MLALKKRLAAQKAQLTPAEANRAMEKLFKELAVVMPTSKMKFRTRCVLCDKPGDKKCGQCNSAGYCSRECQVKDWPLHKFLCKGFADVADLKRPSTSHVRGILFPAGESHAKFVWVKQNVSQGKTSVKADVHVGQYTTAYAFADLNRPLEEIKRGSIGHGLIRFSQTTTADSNKNINKSILFLGEPGRIATWFGNHLILATKKDPECAGNLVLEDVNFRDYRHALDYFQLSRLNRCVVNPERELELTIPAVIIHCDASFLRFTGYGLQSRMEKVQIVQSSVVSGQGLQSILQLQAAGPYQVGLQWYVRRQVIKGEWKSTDPESQIYRNLDAKKLCRYQPYESSSLDALGTILVMDATGAPIEPIHIELFSRFIDSVAEYQPDNLERMEYGPMKLYVGPNDHDPKHAMAAFKRFIENWKNEQVKKGLDMTHFVSPYDLKGPLNPAIIRADTILNRELSKAGCHH